MNQDEPCPLCLNVKNTVLTSGEKLFRRCRRCGAVFNSQYRPASYESSYFNEEYRLQYGKSYIEDFDAIYRISTRRMKRIIDFWQKPVNENTALLDIGSACGFFLKAARDMGLRDVRGIEISRHASEYCRTTFDIPVKNSSFDEAAQDKYFDIITAWYFIEHTRNPRDVLTRIHSMLRPSGIFACSMPSLFGPQYLFRRSEWYLTHPPDHRIDISPATAKKFLKKIGFSRVITCPGGIHPERMLSANNPFFKLFKKLYHYFSLKTSFSDTMEIYAIK